MRPINKTWTMTAASANGICASQQPGAAGNLTLNGALASTEMDTTQLPSVARTVVVLDTCRRIGITSSGNDSTATFTVTGTDNAGTVISEDVTGPNGNTVSTLNSYCKIISVRISKAATGNITVGTTNQADTPWMPLDMYQEYPALNMQHKFSTGASLTWQWQSTLSPAQDGSTAANKLAVNEGAAVTASGVTSVNNRNVTMVRGTISNFVSGSVAYTVAIAQGK